MSANFRQIHTRIWKDEWFLDLQPDEKLLFIYLFSNENTSLSGLYKLAFKIICFETGIDQVRAAEILGKFASSGKVFYSDSIVWIVNMRRYHSSNSIKVQKRIETDLLLIPECDLKIQYRYHMDMLSKVVVPNEEEKENEYEDKHEKENKDDIDDDSFNSLYSAFVSASEIPENMIANGASVETVKKWVAAGYTAGDVREAVLAVKLKGYKIVRPASIDNALIIVKGQASTARVNSGSGGAAVRL